MHDHHTKAPPNVVYAQLKYMWANGAKEESLHFLRQFSTSLSRDVLQETNAQNPRPGVSKQKLAELSKLAARCYFKQGEWQQELKENWTSVGFESCDFSSYFSNTWAKERRRNSPCLSVGDTL